jgi:tRNA G18 (ribose-2'-O)-methylase SpoU
MRNTRELSRVDVGTDVLLGSKSVHAALLSGERPLKRLLLNRDHADGRLAPIEALARSRAVPVELVDRSVLEQLARGGRKDQGVALFAGARPLPRIAALEPSSWTPAPPSPVAMTRERLGSLSSHDVKGALEQWLADDTEDETGDEASNREAGRESGNVASSSAPPVVVGAYRIHDPQNLGAVCRSSLFFGAQQLVLSEARGTLSRVTSAVSSASAGAAEFLRVSQAISFVQFLRESRAAGWAVIGTGVSLGSARKVAAEELHSIAQPKILVLGNEGEGLPRDVAEECDWSCVVERRGAHGDDNLDSLNVSVAAGILLHAATRQ